MTRTFRAAGLFVLVAGAASAQPVDGLYVGLGGGANFQESYKVRDSLDFTGFTQTHRIETNTGAAALGSVGYGFGNGFRVEVEGNYRYNPYKLARYPNFSLPLSQNETIYGATGNVLFDFDVGSPYVFPYIGGGAGAAWTDLPGGTRSKAEFAAQGIAGAAFPIPGVPGLSLTAEYRFYGVFGSEHTASAQTAVPVSTIASVAILSGPGTSERNQRYNHSLLVGLRYAFDVAPPPAPEPPAAEAPPVAAPSRSYLVFFDWDRAVLTTRARAIVKEAADGAGKVSHTTIEVNGFTDTSGTAAYNQGLSVRRADAVAAELVRDGVARGEIAIHGYGETRLLVPTAAGVREPQNRRVEIIIR